MILNSRTSISRFIISVILFFILSGCDVFFPPDFNNPDSEQPGIEDPTGEPDEGEASGDGTEEPFEPAFPDFNITFEEGDYWKFGIKSSWTSDFGLYSGFSTGSFILRLGSAEEIGGVTVYPLEIFEADCLVDDLPRWDYLGISEGVLYGSVDGISLITLFDSNWGIWPGSGFFKGMDPGVLYAAKAGHLTNDFIDSEALKISDSLSESDSFYLPGYGTVYGGGATINANSSEYYSLETGPLGYYNSESYMDYDYQRSDKLEIGLIESSLTGGNWGPLAPPASLTVSQGEFPDKIVLDWEPVAGAVKYNVIRELSRSFIQIAEISGGENSSYTITLDHLLVGLVSGQIYTFYVTAENSFGEETRYSPEATGWIMDHPSDFSMAYTYYKYVPNNTPASGTFPDLPSTLSIGPGTVGAREEAAETSSFSITEEELNRMYTGVLASGFIDQPRVDVLDDEEDYFDISIGEESFIINTFLADGGELESVSGILDTLHSIVPPLGPPGNVTGSFIVDEKQYIDLDWEEVPFGHESRIYYLGSDGLTEPILISLSENYLAGFGVVDYGYGYFIPGGNNYYAVAITDAFGFPGDMSPALNIPVGTGTVNFISDPDAYYSFITNESSNYEQRKHRVLYSSVSLYANPETELELKKETGCELAPFGVSFGREDESNYCALLLRTDGKYSIIGDYGGVLTVYQGWTSMSAINQGLGASNTVRLTLTGPFSTHPYRFTTYINGQQTEQYLYWNELPGGGIGVLCDVGSEEEESFPLIPVHLRMKVLEPDIRPVVGDCYLSIY
ncbi:MAG: fibronectin type III domain-containing protein [Spirochaetales bacterium]|nr:fibronectin type III domain-containing protein [Spirochaetales bacterium]